MAYLISYIFIGIITAFMIDLYIEKHEKEFCYDHITKEEMIRNCEIFGLFLWPIYWSLVMGVVILQLIKRSV